MSAPPPPPPKPSLSDLPEELHTKISFASFPESWLPLSLTNHHHYWSAAPALPRVIIANARDAFFYIRALSKSSEWNFLKDIELPNGKMTDKYMIKNEYTMNKVNTQLRRWHKILLEGNYNLPILFGELTFLKPLYLLRRGKKFWEEVSYWEEVLKTDKYMPPQAAMREILEISRRAGGGPKELNVYFPNGVTWEVWEELEKLEGLKALRWFPSLSDISPRPEGSNPIQLSFPQIAEIELGITTSQDWNLLLQILESTSKRYFRRLTLKCLLFPSLNPPHYFFNKFENIVHLSLGNFACPMALQDFINELFTCHLPHLSELGLGIIPFMHFAHNQRIWPDIQKLKVLTLLSEEMSNVNCRSIDCLVHFRHEGERRHGQSLEDLEEQLLLALQTYVDLNTSLRLDYTESADCCPFFNGREESKPFYLSAITRHLTTLSLSSTRRATLIYSKVLYPYDSSQLLEDCIVRFQNEAMGFRGSFEDYVREQDLKWSPRTEMWFEKGVEGGDRVANIAAMGFRDE